MKVGVIVFPGSNCDTDALYASSIAGHESFPIWHKSKSLNGAEMIILPGGFSYGDYLRCGAIAKFSPIMDEVIRFAKSGGLLLGICNGFQILTECGLLPGALLRNDTLKFESRWVHLKICTNRTPFTVNIRTGDIIKIPIAHGEGRFFVHRDELDRLIQRDQVVFRYFGGNPNGSVHDIAGICNVEGNVLGMMPHPERASNFSIGSADGLSVLVRKGN